MAGTMVSSRATAHDEGLSRDARLRQGAGRARDPGVVGARRPHQERLRPLRGGGLLGARARHVPRQDGQRARRRRQALHGAQHRPGREGPARRRHVPGPAIPRRPSSARSASAWAASSRSSPATLNPSIGAVRQLLRHPSEREARLLEALGPGARALRREGRLRDAQSAREAWTRRSRRRASSRRSTSIRASTTRSSTTSGRTPTTRPRPRTPGGARWLLPPASEVASDGKTEPGSPKAPRSDVRSKRRLRLSRPRRRLSSSALPGGRRRPHPSVALSFFSALASFFAFSFGVSGPVHQLEDHHRRAVAGPRCPP